MSPIQGKIGKTTKNSQNHPAGKWLGSQPRCFPTGESRGNPQAHPNTEPGTGGCSSPAAPWNVRVLVVPTHLGMAPPRGEDGAGTAAKSRRRREKLGMGEESGTFPAALRSQASPGSRNGALAGGKSSWRTTEQREAAGPGTGTRIHGNDPPGKEQQDVGITSYSSFYPSWNLVLAPDVFPRDKTSLESNPEDSGTILQELPEPQ